MAVPKDDPGHLTELVRRALEGDDLGAIGELLDPDVYWGPPDDDRSGCHNREEVIAWWGKARQAGATAEVTEVVAGDDTVLVGLRVRRGGDPVDDSGWLRWQVLRIRHGLVVDIRGYEERALAAARAGVA